MKLRQWIRTVGLIGVVSFVSIGCKPAAQPTAVAFADKREGKPAQDFSLATLDEKTFKLSENTGKVVLLDFWATWCPPCRLSLPHIQELSQNKDLQAKGLRVYAVNADEEKAEIEAFLKANQYSFAVPMDKGSAVMMQYGISSIPTSILVGRDGVIKKVWTGFNEKETPKEIDDAIAAALQ